MLARVPMGKAELDAIQQRDSPHQNQAPATNATAQLYLHFDM
jgi:hypothetical protein